MVFILKQDFYPSHPRPSPAKNSLEWVEAKAEIKAFAPAHAAFVLPGMDGDGRG
jgi:hypothetical protein